MSGEKTYDTSYNIYHVKPFDDDLLEHYIQIPKTWSPEKVTAKSKDLSPTPIPLGLYTHQGNDNTLTMLQVMGASIDKDVSPLKFIQFFLHKVSGVNKIQIHSITTIDEYRAKASADWEWQNTVFNGEIYINISNDRNRVFIIQGLTTEKSKEEWTEQCDYIFRSFAIINKGDA